MVQLQEKTTHSWQLVCNTPDAISDLYLIHGTWIYLHIFTVYMHTPATVSWKTRLYYNGICLKYIDIPLPTARGFLKSTMLKLAGTLESIQAFDAFSIPPLWSWMQSNQQLPKIKDAVHTHVYNHVFMLIHTELLFILTSHVYLSIFTYTCRDSSSSSQFLFITLEKKPHFLAVPKFSSESLTLEGISKRHRRLVWWQPLSYKICKVNPPALDTEVWSDLTAASSKHGIFEDFYLPYIAKS